MRKTLTVLIVALAATSLAACKMFWEKEQAPAATAAVAATSETATEAASTTTPEATKPLAQTAPTNAGQPYSGVEEKAAPKTAVKPAAK